MRRFTQNIRRRKHRVTKQLNGKKKKARTKSTSEREFKVSIKRLVHLHSENNYKWPASPSQALCPTSPLHLCVTAN